MFQPTDPNARVALTDALRVGAVVFSCASLPLLSRASYLHVKGNSFIIGFVCVQLLVSASAGVGIDSLINQSVVPEQDGLLLSHSAVCSA